MKNMLTKQKTKNIEFVGRISKFSGDRKVICIPKSLTKLVDKYYKNEEYVKIIIERVI